MVYVCLVNPEVVDSAGTLSENLAYQIGLQRQQKKGSTARERQDDKNRELDELLTRCKTLQEA